MNSNIKRMLVGAALLAMAAMPVPAIASDDELLKMAKEIPGFGGMYVDDNGALTVYMQDVSRAPEIRTRLDLQALGRRIRVVPGTYAFQDLYRWRDELNDIMAEPNIVSLDIDEKRNRVVIGVDRKAVTRDTLGTLDSIRAASSAPADAVIIEPADPIYNLQSVQGSFRPIPGGVQINFTGFLCTLGFNAIRGGVAGFVTNSHCTGTRGVVNGTTYGQPSLASGTIATETVDPPFFTGGACPAGRVCRRSDSAFARYSNAALQQFRQIARTNNPGSLTVSAAAPRFTITATAAAPIPGQPVNKVGRTTGWSRGNVSQSCVNVNVAGGAPANVTMLCQYTVVAAVAGGDSGSPTFHAGTATTATNATLVGILWGGGGNTFVLSRFTDIVAELGAMTVF